MYGCAVFAMRFHYARYKIAMHCHGDTKECVAASAIHFPLLESQHKQKIERSV